MKNIRHIITILLFTFILLAITSGYYIYDYVNKHNTYSNIVNSNWKIELPSEYKEIYSYENEESFLGDGQRYHVFEYNTDSDIRNSLEWIDVKNINIEAEVLKILSDLPVQDIYLPNFEEKYKYYSKEEMDSSKLYIILGEKDNTVYIAEDFK